MMNIIGLNKDGVLLCENQRAIISNRNLPVIIKKKKEREKGEEKRPKMMRPQGVHAINEA